MEAGFAKVWLCSPSGSTGHSSAKAEVLQDLIDNNGSIIVCDKRFDQFGYLATGDMPDADGVNVVAHVDPDGNLGLRFQGGFVDLVGGGSSDALITYRVKVLDPEFASRGPTWQETRP